MLWVAYDRLELDRKTGVSSEVVYLCNIDGYGFFKGPTPIILAFICKTLFLLSSAFNIHPPVEEETLNGNWQVKFNS